MRARRTGHGVKNARLECTAGEHALLHSSFPFGVRVHLRAAAVPSAVHSLCSPGCARVKHWWKGAAKLQIRSLRGIGTVSKRPASQDFKPAPYSPPAHVLTVCSAPVNRVQSESIFGPIVSMSMGLQRLPSMHPRGLGTAWTWEAQQTLKRSRRSVDWSSSSSAPRGTCTACAQRSASFSAREACGGQGSGLWRCWRVSDVCRSCVRRNSRS